MSFPVDRDAKGKGPEQMQTRWVFIGLGLCFGCGATSDADVDSRADRAASGALGAPSALSNKDFAADFANCSEFAGIGLVPRANARELVPSHYSLAGDATNAVIVVRVARCASAVVDGKALGVTTTSQIGIRLSDQDVDSDIHNYTLFYATDQARLHARLQGAGLKTDVAKKGLSFQLDGTRLNITSSSPHTPAFQISGSVSLQSADPSVFIASWWADGNHGSVRSTTVFPSIRFSGATTTLTTPAGSALAALIGGTSLSFAFLDSYNTFGSAHLEVSQQEPD